MIARILIPLDGSARSDGILGQVRRLLLRQDAEVRLLRVLPEPLKYGPDGPQRKAVAEAQRHLAERAGALNAQGATASHAVLLSGDPAGKILAYAAQYRPSLIAMSTHGRTGMRRWIRGSVAERVLRNSPFPLLLWNPFRKGAAARSPRFSRILVPLDGSARSASVLPLVQELAALYASEVLLFHASELYPVVGDYPVVVLPPGAAEVAKMLEPFRRRLKGLKVRVRSELGSPAACILDAAKTWRADLVAMATHGRSGVSRWAFGSVAEQVLRHGPLPLLVVRSPGK